MPKLPRPKRRPKGEYEIGYCRPPTQHQVKKGQILNPKGRPKGSRSFWADFEDALFAKRSITEADGRTHQVTHQQILIKLVMQQAIGDRDKRSQQLLVQLAMELISQAPPEVEAPPPLTEDEEKLLNAFIRRRAKEIGDE